MSQFDHDPSSPVQSKSALALNGEKDHSVRHANVVDKSHLHNSAVRETNTSPAVLDPGPAPDGGVVAWTQVALGFLVNFNTFGYINSFGIFQDYYVQALGRSASDISWIGSITVCLVFLIGVFSGRAVDAGYYRLVLGAGAFLQLLGTFMTTLATTYWQLFLAQGLCTGLGMGLLFCPTIALISAYFTRNRAVALSSSAAGGAAGGLVFPAIAMRLLPSVGFTWTVRVMGFVMLFNFVFIIAFIRSRVPPRKSGPLVEWAAFKEPPFVLFILGMFLNGLGVYYPYYYVTPYARDVLGVSETKSLSLLLLINGMGIPGRLIPALLADRLFGPMNVLIPTGILSGVLIYVWIAVNSYSGIIAFVVVYGYIAAGVQSLFPATLSSLTPDLSKMGTKVGMVFTIYGLATLTGAPIAGALITGDGGGYLHGQVFGGTAMVCGSLLLLAARTATIGRTLVKRI